MHFLFAVDLTSLLTVVNLFTRRNKQTLKYEFTVPGEMVRVCKTFFMETLSITDRMIFST